MNEKPLLLLDVDGVLNVCHIATWDRRKVTHEGKNLHPEAYTLDFMKLAWSNADVWWCSAWMQHSNIWARWAGLMERPCIVDIVRPSRSKYREDWKLHCARRLFGRDSWRRIIWIEDGFSEETRQWARKHRNWKLIDIDPELGVGPALAHKLGWKES